MARSTTNVWARDVHIGRNCVRQLLVREHDNVELVDNGEGTLLARSPYGSWPTQRGSRVGPDEPLTASLPVIGSGEGPIHWQGSREQLSPDRVLESFDGSIGFTAHDRPNSLRRPQIAALHSIVGYQSSGLADPGIVIMPTGTGKTETMLAWLVAQCPTRVLVIVPSIACATRSPPSSRRWGFYRRKGSSFPRRCALAWESWSPGLPTQTRHTPSSPPATLWSQPQMRSKATTPRCGRHSMQHSPIC